MAKILLVDDSEDLIDFLVYLLKANGHEVKSAASNKELKPLLSSFPADLIIIDAFLNGENGRDICKEIKASSNYWYIPILLMSASPQHLENYKECQADGILEKPFDIKTLIDKVDSMLSLAIK